MGESGTDIGNKNETKSLFFLSIKNKEQKRNISDASDTGQKATINLNCSFTRKL